MPTACLANGYSMTPAPIAATPDAEDARAAAGGDRAAFQRLYRRHVDRIHGAVLRLAGYDHARAEDLTQDAFVRAVASRLDKEGVAHDIAFHRDATPHFRIWAGATIEAADLAVLTEWLDWGYAVEKAALSKAAA